MLHEIMFLCVIYLKPIFILFSVAKLSFLFLFCLLRKCAEKYQRFDSVCLNWKEGMRVTAFWHATSSHPEICLILKTRWTWNWKGEKGSRKKNAVERRRRQHCRVVDIKRSNWWLARALLSSAWPLWSAGHIVPRLNQSRWIRYKPLQHNPIKKLPHPFCCIPAQPLREPSPRGAELLNLARLSEIAWEKKC